MGWEVHVTAPVVLKPEHDLDYNVSNDGSASDALSDSTVSDLQAIIIWYSSPFSPCWL